MRLSDEDLARVLQQPGYRLVGDIPSKAPGESVGASRGKDDSGVEAVSERVFMERLRRLVVEDLGYLWYHTYSSKKSTPGWPDCVMVPPAGGPCWIWELKAAGGQVSPAQRRWLEALQRVTRIDARVVRPQDWSLCLDLLTRRTP